MTTTTANALSGQAGGNCHGSGSRQEVKTAHGSGVATAGVRRSKGPENGRSVNASVIRMATGSDSVVRLAANRANFVHC